MHRNVFRGQYWRRGCRPAKSNFRFGRIPASQWAHGNGGLWTLSRHWGSRLRTSQSGKVAGRRVNVSAFTRAHSSGIPALRKPSHEQVGVSGSFLVISLQRLSGIRGSEPACVTRLVSEHDQPHIRSPFATAAPTSRLRRAGLRKTRTFLENGVSGHGLRRFVHLDPSGTDHVLRIIVLDSWKTGLSSGSPNHGAFDYDFGAHIFPERDQQLSRQRHDRRLAPTTAVTFRSVLEPEGECRARLMA